MAEYIDRQEAILALLDSPTSRGGLMWASDALKRLADVPTADVAPVVHGRWKYHKYTEKYECVECGHFVMPGTDRNFCPNCGAKMDKEAHDGE